MNEGDLAKRIADIRQHGCHYAEGTCEECAAIARAIVDMQSTPLRERAADPALVKTRAIEFTEVQQKASKAIQGVVAAISPNAETAIALLVDALAQFIMKTAEKDKLPEAVETAIECLRINTGQCICPWADDYFIPQNCPVHGGPDIGPRKPRNPKARAMAINVSENAEAAAYRSGMSTSGVKKK